MANVIINSSSIVMAIDTGATVSVIRHNVAEKLKLEIMKEDQIQLKTFDGSSLEMVGKCKVKMTWRK